MLAALALGAGPRSGFETMTPELQAMQQDDFANPGMLFVADGEARFQREGCTGCHAPAALAGAAARRIPGHAGADRLCRQPLPRHAARARPRPRLDPARAEGAALFRARRGPLNLSCAQCHDDNAGHRLAGSLIPEGHANGYPLYRLEWQGLGSLQRRLRNCLAGVRSEPYPPGAPEYLALEAYLAVRARGLTVETPAIRP